VKDQHVLALAGVASHWALSMKVPPLDSVLA